MVFSSIEFLYWFLPISIILYFTAFKKGKNFVLLLCSLFFYFYGEQKYIVVMLLSILTSYAFGFLIDKAKNKKTPLIFSIFLSVIPLLYFKYTDFFIANTNSLLGTDFNLLRLVLPIGISFYTFQTISYTIDLYRGQANLQKNLISYASYVSLFPQLIAGPIVRYTLIEKSLNERTHSLEKFSQGVFRFTIGLSKKILLANVIGEFCDKYTQSSSQSVVFAWTFAIAYSLQIYLDFSAYSDMAIGLGKIFGFDFPENFNYPFISKSITEFWRRWHMTLGTWFRDYVYIPMGGNRVSKPKWIINILVVWLLTGFWHGANWNFIIWGLYFAILLAVEKLFLAKILEKLPSVISRTYLLLTVLVSFLIFASEDMNFFANNISILFGQAEFVNPETIYYLKSYAIIIIIGIIASTPFVKNLINSKKDSNIIQVLSPIVMILLLIVSTAFLVDGSFDPFLYFRF